MYEAQVDVAKDAARLAQSLDEQVALFQQWLALEDEKREALLSRNRSALEQAVASQAELLRSVERQQVLSETILCRSRSEAKRHAVADGRASVGANSPEAEDAEAGWEHLVAVAPPRWASSLEAQRAALVKLVDEVREKGRENQHLLRLAMAHNAAILQAFVGHADDGTYGPLGTGSTGTEANVRRGRVLVDRQA